MSFDKKMRVLLLGLLSFCSTPLAWAVEPPDPNPNSPADRAKYVPVTGIFHDWLSLVSSGFYVKKVDNKIAYIMAEYFIRYNVEARGVLYAKSEIKHGRSGLNQNDQKDFQFCGYRIDNPKFDHDGFVKVKLSLQGDGITYDIESDSDATGQHQSAMGELRYRYIMRKSGPYYDCNSDGYSMLPLTIQSGHAYQPPGPTPGHPFPPPIRPN